MFEITYNKNKVDNNFLTPFQTNNQPRVSYNFDNNKFYTLIMYDPDTKHGDYIHWLIVNIKNNVKNGDILINYKGPAPPINTGIHRYIFILFEQEEKFNIKDLPYFDRIINIQKLFNILNLIKNPIEIKYFTSKYLNGGNKILNYKTYKKNYKINNKKKKNKTIKNKINKRK